MQFDCKCVYSSVCVACVKKHLTQIQRPATWVWTSLFCSTRIKSQVWRNFGWPFRHPLRYLHVPHDLFFGLGTSWTRDFVDSRPRGPGTREPRGREPNSPIRFSKASYSCWSGPLMMPLHLGALRDTAFRPSVRLSLCLSVCVLRLCGQTRTHGFRVEISRERVGYGYRRN